MAVDKSIKELASAILKKNGIEHDKWLTEKYTELILENASILRSGIEEKKESKKEIKTEIKNDVVSNNQESQNNSNLDNKIWEQNI